MEIWKELKKLKINTFKDRTEKLCWVFYYKDLEKLFKKKKNKWAERSNNKIIRSLKATHNKGTN